MSVAIRHPAMAVIPVINVFVTLMTLLMEPPYLRKPFRVIWNYPDKSCRRMGYDFNLMNYTIESNSQSFIEDTIALYYSANFGKWPYFEFGNQSDKPIYGGWPHNYQRGPHLHHLHNAILTHQSPHATGFGIIDMELWRPILKTNYGLFEPYRQKMIDFIAKTRPDLTTLQEQRNKATEIWGRATKQLMLTSLSMARMTRPKVYWGYYGYPEKVTAPFNHELDWLWKSVTAYYPSIYIKNYSMPIEDVEEDVKASIFEAYRMRAMFGDPDHPIMAYVDVQNLPEEGREDWLRLQLDVPIEMGADGIILWASSKQFSPNPREKCQDIEIYVKDEIGPRLAELTRYMSACSKQLCTDRGRCVRKEFARNYPYLLTRGIDKRGDGLEEVEPLVYKKIYTLFKRDYQCQCYTGWYGKRCVEREMKEEDKEEKEEEEKR